MDMDVKWEKSSLPRSSEAGANKNHLLVQVKPLLEELIAPIHWILLLQTGGIDMNIEMSKQVTDLDSQIKQLVADQDTISVIGMSYPLIRFATREIGKVFKTRNYIQDAYGKNGADRFLVKSALCEAIREAAEETSTVVLCLNGTSPQDEKGLCLDDRTLLYALGAELRSKCSFLACVSMGDCTDVLFQRGLSSPGYEDWVAMIPSIRSSSWQAKKTQKMSLKFSISTGTASAFCVEKVWGWRSEDAAAVATVSDSSITLPITGDETITALFEGKMRNWDGHEKEKAPAGELELTLSLSSDAAEIAKVTQPLFLFPGVMQKPNPEVLTWIGKK